jgi:Fe-S-cluster containining protein
VSKAVSTKNAVKYDCAKCPGYCCSYPRIVTTAKDIARLAKHFQVSEAEAKKRFTRRYRWASVYEARPEVCRAFPNGKTCGYYQFLKFERKQQGDDSFIPSA